MLIMYVLSFHFSSLHAPLTKILLSLGKYKFVDFELSLQTILKKTYVINCGYIGTCRFVTNQEQPYM